MPFNPIRHPPGVIAWTRLSALLALCTAFATTGSSATFNVSSSTELQSRLDAAQPGDTLLLADGNYSGFTITRSGTAAAPITVQAAHVRGAVITSGIVRLNQVSFVTVSGLKLTTSGVTQTVDGESFPVAVWLEGTISCRVSRCDFKLTRPANSTVWVMLSGAGDSNRIDHCDFGPNTVDGCHYIWPRGQRTIPGVTPPSDRTAWAEGRGPVNPAIVRRTRIDHNYLHDMASGTAEVIVTGGLGVTGDYQDVATLIESNLFENCDGDPEFISVKSSGNVIRYNTVRTCVGMISLRAGNGSAVHGNFFFQAGKSGAGGIKIYEKNHVVYNNYIDSASEYPLLVGAGDAYTSSSFAHAQVFNARIVHNTIVRANNRPVIMGHGSTLSPTDVVFANNLVQGSATLFSNRVPAVGNSVYAANLASSSSGLPVTGWRVADPLLAASGELLKLTAASPAVNAADATYASLASEDMDGQPRATPDIGADELSTAPAARRPLTAADVGPDSPDDAAAPVIAKQPASATIAAGDCVVFQVIATGADVRYQWRLNGAALVGATDAALLLRNVSPADAGNYDVVVSNSAGAIPSSAAALSITTTSNPGRLTNLSIRANAATGAQTLIVGAVVRGGDAGRGMSALLRVSGPSLAPFGVPGTLPDPELSLLVGEDVVVASNDNWNGDAVVSTVGSRVGAFGFASPTSLDAALYRPSLTSGSYTMWANASSASAANARTGVVLAEIYDATLSPDVSPVMPRLVNVSARTHSGTGDAVLITGFAIGGETSRTVLIRGIGPTLAAFGVPGALADPQLELFQGNTSLAANDNWSGGATLTNAFDAVGAFKLDATAKDAALLVTLPPGSYTAQISGVGATTGIALVEVYDVR